MKRYYDDSIKPKNFKTGSFFLMYSPKHRQGQYCRWQVTWTCPYRIVHQINGTNYVIPRTKRSKSSIVHADRLKGYHGELPKEWDDTRSNVVPQSAVYELHLVSDSPVRGGAQDSAAYQLGYETYGKLPDRETREK